MRTLVIGIAAALLVITLLTWIKKRRRLRGVRVKPGEPMRPHDRGIRSTIRLAWWVAVAVMATVTIVSWIRFYLENG